MTQGPLAPIGGIAGQPVPPEGEMFAAVFGKPPSVPVLGEAALPTADATGGGAVWAVIAPATTAPFVKVKSVAPPDFAGVRLDAAPVESGDVRLEAWEDVQLSGPPSVPVSAGEGMEGMASPPALGSGSERAPILPDPIVVPGPADRRTDASASAAGSLPGGPPPIGGVTDERTDRVPQEEPIARSEAGRPLTRGADDLVARVSEPLRPVQTGEEMHSRGPEVVTAGLPTQARGVGGEGGGLPAIPAVPTPRAVLSAPDRLSVFDRPAVPADLAGSERLAVSAVPVLPAPRAVPAASDRLSVPDLGAVPSIPAVPAMTSGVSVHVPSVTDSAPIPLAPLPSDPGRAQIAEPNIDSPPVNADLGVAPSGQQVATEAERVWLGRLHWHDALAGEIEGNVRETTPPPAAAEAATPIIRAGRDPKAVAQANAAFPVTTLQATYLEEPLPQDEPDGSPITWSPAGQMVLTGSAAAGTLPAGTVSQFAAAMVATLHQKADGTTEIALSPNELGSVRLRLEADARDPERMIVHLVFDRPETMDLFRRHADQLSEAIRAAGYAEARLDFGQSGTGADPRGGEQAADAAKPPHSLTERDQARVPPTFDRPSPPRLASTAGLDLRL